MDLDREEIPASLFLSFLLKVLLFSFLFDLERTLSFLDFTARAAPDHK